MDFLRGLLDIITSAKKLASDTINGSGGSGDSSDTVPTLKEILGVLKDIKTIPAQRITDRPEKPPMPKFLPMTPPPAKGPEKKDDWESRNPPTQLEFPDIPKMIPLGPAPKQEAPQVVFSEMSAGQQTGEGESVDRETERASGALENFTGFLKDAADRLKTIVGMKPPESKEKDSGESDERPRVPEKPKLWDNLRGKRWSDLSGGGSGDKPPFKSDEQGKGDDDDGGGGIGKMIGKMTGGKLGKAAGIGGIVVGLGVALVKLRNKLVDFAEGVNEQNKQISKFSGQMAASFAQLDIQEFRQNMQLAQQTEGTGSELAAQIRQMREEGQPLREMAQTFKNRFSTNVAVSNAAILKKLTELSELLGLLDVAEDIERNTRDEEESTPGVQAMTDVSSGRWLRDHPAQALPID